MGSIRQKMYQMTDEPRQLYGYDTDERREYDYRRYFHRERRKRYEQRQRRTRRKRQKLLFICLFYFFLGMAVSAGLFLLGNDWISAEKNPQNAEAAGYFSAGGDKLTIDDRDFFKGIIYLDAGHGGYDPGANHQEILEKDINLDVAKKVEQYLAESGWEVRMTRTEDVKIDNLMRAQMANEANANVFVSIHCNYLEKGDADGIEIYYDSNNSQGGLLGEKILKQMILQTKANNRGVRSEDFAVTRETKMPSVLIELGYLSDIDERARLMEDNYRDLLARGIADGILAYLKE